MKKLLFLAIMTFGAMFCQAQNADTLIKKHIILDSVVIMPMPEYKKFIRDIEKMPQKRPLFVPGISKADDEKQIYKKPIREPKGSAVSPITLIYNRYNKRERFKRKLQRNRRKFNREMERIGADSLMIPE